MSKRITNAKREQIYQDMLLLLMRIDSYWRDSAMLNGQAAPIEPKADYNGAPIEETVSAILKRHREAQS